MTAASWEPGTDWGTVRVTADDDGLVVVDPSGGVSPRDVHGARLDVVGGTVVVDITHPDAPPRSVLGEPDLAQVWLTDVYGAAVADAVADAAATREVHAVRGPVSSTVAQLGVGTWLHRWWPDRTADRPGVDERLLEIELGTLAWQAEACFPTTGQAARLLTPHLELVADLWESLEAHGAGADDAILAEVQAGALAATVDVVSPTTPGWARCAAHLATLTEQRRVEAATLPSADLWAALERSLDRELMGVGSGPPARRTRFRSRRAPDVRAGRSTVDVLQVPPRVVSADPDNIDWRVRARDGAHHVEVTVTPAFGRTTMADPLLLAAVVVAGVPTVFPLRPVGDILRGEAELVRSVVDDDPVAVEVYHSDYVTTLRSSDEGRTAAEADRAELARVLDERLAAIGPRSLQAEREAVRRRSS